MNLLLRWILNTLALFIVVTIVPHFHYRSIVTLAVAAAVLGLLNAIVKPILFWLTLPVTIVTVGLFLIVLNGLMLEITSFFTPGFSIDSFGWAMVGSIVLALVSLVTNRIGERGSRE
jgi:putative membrane protein